MPDSPTLQPTIPGHRVANYIAAALLVILAVLLVASVRQQSQVFDETTHLLAGFEYWKHADFGRNPEHPIRSSLSPTTAFPASSCSPASHT